MRTMICDLQNAWITKAIKAGPGEVAKVYGEGLMELSSKIFQIFDPMSAADLPLMILALRNAERAISNSKLAKVTNAVKAADALDSMLRPEVQETMVAIPRDLIDRAEGGSGQGPDKA